MKKIMFFICSIFIILSFCGCNLSNSMFSSIFEKQYTEENYKVAGLRDGTIYTFYENLELLLFNNDKIDELKVIYEDNSRGILSGHFIKVGYNKDKLFIDMDNIYYVFDIQKCIDSNNESNYLLNKLDYESFIKQYPEYKTYDWDF